MDTLFLCFTALIRSTSRRCVSTMMDAKDLKVDRAGKSRRDGFTAEESALNGGLPQGCNINPS